MYKYVVDTNVLYGLAFNDEIHCITENAFNVLKGNIGIVTYGTLFEAFDRYRNQKESLQTGGFFFFRIILFFSFG